MQHSLSVWNWLSGMYICQIITHLTDQSQYFPSQSHVQKSSAQSDIVSCFTTTKICFFLFFFVLNKMYHYTLYKIQAVIRKGSARVNHSGELNIIVLTSAPFMFIFDVQNLFKHFTINLWCFMAPSLTILARKFLWSPKTFCDDFIN